MNEITMYKWLAGAAGSGCLALASFVFGQVSMTDEIAALRTEMRKPNPVVQAQLESVQRQLDDIKEILRDTE